MRTDPSRRAWLYVEANEQSWWATSNGIRKPRRPRCLATAAIILAVAVALTGCAEPRFTEQDELGDLFGLCVRELAESRYTQDLAASYELDRDWWQEERLEMADRAAEAGHEVTALLIGLNQSPSKIAEDMRDIYFECVGTG